MPPRTRNGGRGRLMALGVAVNTTGLPALPLEILLEIISHFLSVPSPCKVQHVLSCAYLERPHALRALSETCKRLRSAFLARAWERIEVCASRRVSESYSYRKHDYDSTYDRETNLWSNELAIELATELVRQMEVVTIRNPALAQQVKTVTIVLSEWCSDTVLPDFFASLSQLPNLDTLQILYAPPGSDKYVLGHRYPSVRTLVLSGNVSQFMAYCPNVERIDVFRLISFLPRLTPQQFPRLRAFNCMIIDAEALKALVRDFPNLAEVPPLYVNGLNPNDITELYRGTNLQRIDFFTWFDALPSPETLALVEVAKQVLCTSSSQGPGKCVTLDSARGLYLKRTYPVE